MTNWFYQLEGQEALGPVPTETLKTLAKKGILKPTDLLWKNGYEKWVKAKRLQGLFPESTSVLPPIPDDRKNKTESTSGQNKQVNIHQRMSQPKTAKIQEKDSTQINLDQLINPDKNIAQANYNLNKTIKATIALILKAVLILYMMIIIVTSFPSTLSR